MKQPIGKKLLLVWLMALTPLANAALTATVDRTQVSELDLLTYTLRLEDSTTTESPNFSSLSRDFDIVQQSGPNRSTSIRIINGRQEAEAYTQWVLTLRPRRTGTLQIPAVRIGSQVTQPITVRVTEASAAARRQMDQFVFFETSVDKENSYVQEQIIYTVKLFYVDSISGDFPPPPQLDNAVIETIENEKRYESIVNNRRFFVLEKQYAIYPQRSGILELPAETFTGTRGRGSFFGARERVVAVSQGHRLQIEPRPPSFSGDDWLPATALTVEESWSTGFGNFRVGEPVNRTITVRAAGLASSLLPPLGDVEIEGAKTYQDPETSVDETTADGIESTTSFTVGIVPTREGEIVIPEIRIPWWNTVTDREEVAILPAHTIQVAAGEAPSVRVPAADAPAEAYRPEAGQPTARPSSLWLYVALAIAALWLLTLWQLIVARQALRRTRRAPAPASPAAQIPGEADSYRALVAACRANNASATGRALFAWGIARYPGCRTLRDIANASGHAGLRQEIAAMEASLFSPEGSADAWDGGGLLAAVDEIRRTSPAKTGKTDLASTLNPS